MTTAIWIEAARPKTLAAGIAPVALGTLLALPTFSLLTLCFTFLTALAIQIGTNFANDYYDFVKGADTAERKGPRRMTQAGLIRPAAMKRAVFFTFASAALLSSYLSLQGGPIFGILTTLAILLGIGYTTGPWPLAYLGLGDLFVLVFFGPVATLSTYFLQTHQFDLSIGILGLSPGLLSMAILTANNLRDIDEDRKCGKKTLCVRFGELFGRIEYTVSVAVACLIPLMFGYYLPLITLVPALIPIKTVWTANDKTKLNATLAQTGKLLLLFIALFAVSLAL